MISIIMPAYNASKYISQTIKSVQAQTYTNWEMIIVEDCSTDKTFDIAFNAASIDKRITVIRNEINSGVAFSRNQALDIACGDYVAFLDSDDLWRPEKLEMQYNFMENNKFALTYTNYQLFFSDDNRLGKIISVPLKMTYEDIFKNTSIACLTVMVNRKMVGPFHMPLLEHTEDQCTWQEILKRGYIAHALNENLAIYRISNNSLTSSKRKVIKKQWNTYRNYYKFSLFKSSCYFIYYAVNAFKKHF